MRIVARLAKQLEAGVSHRGDGGGTEFVLMVPAYLSDPVLIRIV
jgi:hypothetical protein